MKIFKDITLAIFLIFPGYCIAIKKEVTKMKKSLLLILSLVLLLGILAGCAKAPATEKEADDMMDKPAETMAASHEPEMSESPEPETTAEPSEEPMEEDMMVGMKTEAGYIDVTPEEAKKLIESTPGLVILDVSPLHDKGHIPGAINHYVGDGSLDEAIKTLDKGVPYLVYCHSDSASISGSKKLVAAGFDPVYRIIGNYGAWVAAGYPVE